MARDRNRGGGRRGQVQQERIKRPTHYKQLKNPFPFMKAVSDDEINSIHQASLSLLESRGIKVLLPEAIRLFEKAGAKIGEDQMVYIGRDIVEAAIHSAPSKVHFCAPSPENDVFFDQRSLAFCPCSGTPHATDLERGRRPGRGQDFKELVQLAQHFDILHLLTPMVEAQDIAQNVRHYFYMSTQLEYSTKMPFVYSRGTPQVMDSFEIIRNFKGLSDDEFINNVHAYTIINTNSPRQIDIPMGQGLIDHAKFGQVSVITPFTLMGAMAPITVAGAIMLSHAEALAALVLTQITREGAPVLYGTFTSNVDMKSGAPAFGTPEQFKATLMAGQLARLVDIPWRCAAGSASNINDAQAANENQFALWGCLLGGVNMVKHAAGWLEGGLAFSYEKLITDMEVLQMVAEICVPTPASEGDIALDAHNEVMPGGHFFGSSHTMERYQTAFYEPINADWSNFGSWTEKGEQTASQRATTKWKEILANDPKPKEVDQARVQEMKDFIAKRTEEGGAYPES